MSLLNKQTMENPNNRRIIILPMSPAKHAAQMGLKLGGYLLLVYLIWMYIPSIPLLIFLYILGLLATPIVAYRLGRKYRDFFPQEAPYPFAIAWAHGSQMFFFASIILLLPMYYYYTSALPSQIPTIEQMLALMYKQNPASKALLQQMYGTNPLDIIYKLTDRENLWMNLWTGFSSNIFLGAIVSVFNAFILRRKASISNNPQSDK